ncbi:two-component system regulatory protein YycI [Fructilactobacillus myrtifloralis]|uniref:Two-component system regulatory protein YycI n=1 Tax=Fructilactobacillus myrtifloralis TaxID=2940301 RepID=A0ABY5BNI0_9LACO|nr:two-component system regulatory protein YycI [Fructilactobacillus myrtifloralis]USS84653.1 two-component system regulatory protein YycI [Fructilactobacillus myrtifloralis]
MNFKRIQGIFLIAFIVIDVFLFMMTKNSKVQDDSANAGNVNTTIIKDMKRDNITVGPLSTAKHTGYYLSAEPQTDLGNRLATLKDQNARSENGAIISDLRTPVKVSATHPERTITKLLRERSGFVLDAKQYRYDPDLSTRTKVVYAQQSPVGPFFSSNAQLTFSVANQRVIGYTQRELGNVKILHDKADLITEERAVISLYQYNELPNNAKILWKKLAYTRFLELSGKEVYIPTWVIAMNTKSNPKVQIKRINALNGASFNTEKVQEQPNGTAKVESVKN